MSALFPTMTGATATTAVMSGKVAADVIKDVARGSFDYVMDNKDNIANGVANGVGGLLSIGNAIFETIRENEFNNPLFTHLGIVGSKFGQIVAAARQEGMENGVGEAGKNFFSSIRNTISNVVTQVVPEDVREKISDFVNKSKDKMSTEYGDEFVEVKDFINDVRESVREKVDEIYVDKDAEPRLGDAISEVENNSGECFTENDDYDDVDHDIYECGSECVDYEDDTDEYSGPCH